MACLKVMSWQSTSETKGNHKCLGSIANGMAVIRTGTGHAPHTSLEVLLLAEKDEDDLSFKEQLTRCGHIRRRTAGVTVNENGLTVTTKRDRGDVSNRQRR